MKSFTRFIVLCLLVLAGMPSGVFAQVNNSPVSALGANEDPGIKFTANFRYQGTASQKIDLKAWIKESTATTWLNQSIDLAEIPQSAQPVTANFAATFDYSDLGIQMGKQYLYIVHGVFPPSGSGQDYTTPACFTAGTGVTPCPNAQQQSLSVSLSGMGVSAGSTATVFDYKFDITPLSPLPAAKTVTLRVFNANNQGIATTLFRDVSVSLPAGNYTTSPTVEDVPVGSYIAYVRDGTFKMSNDEPFTIAQSGTGSGLVVVALGQTVVVANGNSNQDFTVTPSTPFSTATTLTFRVFRIDAQGNTVGSAVLEQPLAFTVGSAAVAGTANNLTPGSYEAAAYQGVNLASNKLAFNIVGPNAQQPNQPTAVSGVIVQFPPNLQVIGNTSATLKGIVSVNLAMPVNLSAGASQLGGVIGQLQPAFQSAMMQPGQADQFSISFNGLSPGQTYSFVIKNNLSNVTSDALQFTTSGGATPGGVVAYSGGLFPYVPTPPGQAGTAADPIFTDTISDKGIVPKCGRTAGEGVLPEETRMCTFNDFMQLIANVIQFTLVILGPIVAIIVMYTGAMIIFYSSKSDPTAEITAKRKEYMKLLVRIFIGIVIVLLAWVFVATIFREMGVKAEYNFLDILS